MDTREQARDAVRTAMGQQGLSIAAVTRATNLDKATIGDFLAGDRWPRPASLTKLDEALGWAPGTIDRISRGIETDVRPTNDDPTGVLLDIDLTDLNERDRDLVVTAARLRALEVAREVRRGIEEK